MQFQQISPDELKKVFPGASLSTLKRNQGTKAAPTTLAPPPAIHKRHKYCAHPTTVDGITFASKKEANRYLQLKALEKAGKVCSLKLQPDYPITINNVTVCKYVADFTYVSVKQVQGIRGPVDEHTIVVEDVKGYRTPIYRLKKKLFEAAYAPLTITEV